MSSLAKSRCYPGTPVSPTPAPTPLYPQSMSQINAHLSPHLPSLSYHSLFFLLSAPILISLSYLYISASCILHPPSFSFVSLFLFSSSFSGLSEPSSDTYGARRGYFNFFIDLFVYPFHTHDLCGLKSFERPVLSYLKAITDPLLDPPQFAYRANWSIDNAVNMASTSSSSTWTPQEHMPRSCLWTSALLLTPSLQLC